MGRWLLCVFAIAWCKRGPPPAPAATPITERFVLGVVPKHSVSSLYGEAPKCTSAFPASRVVAIDDGGTPHLVAEGLFHGGCDGLDYMFESVKVASVDVRQSSSHVGLAPLELDSAHPEWTISFQAVPLDLAGNPLEPGWYSTTSPYPDVVRGYARWRPGPGCEKVVKLSRYDFDPPNLSYDTPAESLALAPVGKGACTFTVDYFDASTKVTVTVR
jgi:hypothetical protein